MGCNTARLIPDWGRAGPCKVGGPWVHPQEVGLKEYNAAVVAQENCLIHYEIPSDLGPSWAPAVAETSAELDVIKNGNSHLSDVTSFWMGGSTTEPHQTIIKHNQYRTDTSGNNSEFKIRLIRLAFRF